MQDAIRRRVDAGNPRQDDASGEGSNKLVPKTSQGRASLPAVF